MYAAAIILFREILEIAIILSVIMAAARGVKGRGVWIGAGLLGGVLGSALVAYFTDTIADGMHGMGQEIFNAGILLVAVMMIAWTVIWMKQHARELVARLKTLGTQVKDGQVPLTAMAIVISLCVWREGAEIVLFMYGLMSTSQATPLQLFSGALIGAGVAGVIGTLLYLGLLRIPMKYFFATTEWLLILLACGLSAQAANFLVAAGALPSLIHEMWDTSALLSQNSIAGQVLHALLGYSDRPSGMQLIFYGTTLGLILSTMRFVNWQQTKTKTPTTTAAAS